jgi:putative aminopeptidase FrvX
MLNLPFLKSLLASPGPSSFESKPAAVWREQATKYGAKIDTDAYGSVFAAFNEGKKPRVMLAGHIDEIGLMVTHIDKEGFLYFKEIGGWDSQQLVGQRVRILSYTGKELLGVIGKKAIHLMNDDDKKKVSKIEDLWIDIGAKNESDAKAHVRVGDAAVLEQPYIELLNRRIASKAIDNRISAYMILEAAKRASDGNCKAEVVAVATVQEEISLLGAMTGAYGLEPDVVLAVDVTQATDTPNTRKPNTNFVSLGSGPTLALGSVVHRGVFNMLVEAAEAEKIPYSIEASPDNTGTDADDTARVRAGIPTAVVSIPNRYMHSGNEMVDLQDVENVITLLTTFIKRLDTKTKFVQP